MAKKPLWQQGDPATMIVGGKRMPVAVLGVAATEGDDEPKVRVRLVDGTEREIHSNSLIAPGQEYQYRQRRARIEKGGVAIEANRMAREGWTLSKVLDVDVKEEEEEDYRTRAVKMATLLFERPVPHDIEKVSISAAPPPPPPREEQAPIADDDDEPKLDERASEGDESGDQLGT